ncbi:MAG: HipA domain-containing protein [Hyphomicrobium sp.]|nr:HipA domain-containing protein [Hyphomicrobium sp.]
MHSLSGLLHADHRTASLDYDAFLKATQILTKDITEVERAFRLACFNVLARNRDDHAKNVSFLLDDATGQWTLAPAYDLTFSSGPGGEQSMTMMGEGKSPDSTHLRALAKKHDLKSAEAILSEVTAAIAHWHHHADAAGPHQEGHEAYRRQDCATRAEEANRQSEDGQGQEIPC